jgi:hypothetical protein
MCFKIKAGLRKRLGKSEVMFFLKNLIDQLNLKFFVRKKFWKCGHIFSI